MSTPTIRAPRPRTIAQRRLAPLVRKLHAAELGHLRRLSAEQQARIDELEADCARLQNEVYDEAGRADMFLDLVNTIGGDGLQLGITRDGQVGVLA